MMLRLNTKTVVYAAIYIIAPSEQTPTPSYTLLNQDSTAITHQNKGRISKNTGHRAIRNRLDIIAPISRV